MKKPSLYGTLSISETVFDFILDVVVSEMEGIEQIQSNVKRTLKRIVGKRKSMYSDETFDENEGLTLGVEIGIKYGECIPLVCYTLQEKIKQEVEMMTGFQVNEINIVVSTLIMEEEQESI
ncbi:Asp23/Gls24 family envelope stress response protein [Guptibacillus algicola]|uniref:Asp23/Gls24 family envelope stress response protein n=1 Tax=Guptibacillus algicola TaxID=225844 RepID=UPI001CD73F91|nr:Asp23/Gls24 family envelope stress response protein [Alkalihalobacillus algicola]MCA0987941.1 Asp23/Gls24 family envelope stress response protein [Alkalihalobacillus algicola]